MRIFVTGTDTDVGKTVVSAWLCYHLKASYWKPVQSGTSEGTDSKTVWDLSKTEIFPETYSLKAPLSPHLAASLEEVQIDLEKINLPKTDKPLIIEGAGGVMAPLNNKHTILDLIEHLKVPTIVVARSTLGTINHTCLTLQALRSRSLLILGVIMNGPQNSDNKEAIEHFGKTKVLAEIEPLRLLTKEAISQIPFPSSLHGLLNGFSFS
ncbi:MAG: dethiobiotin synthase [Alphaproteobacteria bacterium]|nr:dethiobiotin synthase [Alphaproteobacteria bacterium]